MPQPMSVVGGDNLSGGNPRKVGSKGEGKELKKEGGSKEMTREVSRERES